MYESITVGEAATITNEIPEFIYDQICKAFSPPNEYPVFPSAPVQAPVMDRTAPVVCTLQKTYRKTLSTSEDSERTQRSVLSPRTGKELPNAIKPASVEEYSSTGAGF